MSSRRRSNRSRRRYAASMRSLLTWAKASSETSGGVSVHPAAQSRKLDRTPCGTASISSAQERRHRRTAQSTSGRRRKNDTAAIGQLPSVVEHLDRTIRQRHPNRALVADLLPSRVAHLAGASGGEHQKLEREHGSSVCPGAPQPHERRSHVRVWQCALVLLDPPFLGSAAEMASPAGLSARNPCARALFVTAPMRCRTRRRSPLDRPDRQQEGHDVGRGDGAHGFGTDPGQRIGAKTCAPLFF